MDRGVRFQIPGLLFYLAVVLNMIVTTEGLDLWDKAFHSPAISLEGTIGVVFATGLITIFSSISVGYLFNLMAFCLWNTWGQPSMRFRDIGANYAVEWKRLGHSFKTEFLEQYGHQQQTDGHRGNQGGFQYADYTEDVFLSFFWHQAPEKLREWVSRRHTSLFLGRSSILALASGLWLSWFLINRIGLHPTGWNVFVSSCVACMFVPLWLFSRAARIEGRQLIDLWIARAQDPAAKAVLARMEALYLPKDLNVRTGKSEIRRRPK